MIKKYFGRFPHAIRGILYALTHDFGYRTQIILGVGLAIFIGVVLSPLTQTEFLLIAFAYALILITELQNSALEIALDRLHPERHEDIRRSKDMAAGAVLTAGIFLCLVIGTIYLT